MPAARTRSWSRRARTRVSARWRPQARSSRSSRSRSNRSREPRPRGLAPAGVRGGGAGRLATGCAAVAADGGRGGRDSGAMSTRILLDCDPGHDDAIAMLLALASPELELVGVTTVAGNQTLDTTTRNALVTLEISGRRDV